MGTRVGVDDTEKRDVSCSRSDLDPGFLISLLWSCCLLVKESAACYKLLKKHVRSLHVLRSMS